MEGDDARQETPALLVREDVDAPAPHASDDGVRRAEVDSNDRHREGLTTGGSCESHDTSSRRSDSRVNHTTRPFAASADGPSAARSAMTSRNHPPHRARERPHPPVVGAYVAPHDLLFERTRCVETAHLGRSADRFDVGLPLEASPPPRQEKWTDRDEVDERHRDVAHRRRWRRWTRSCLSRMYRSLSSICGPRVRDVELAEEDGVVPRQVLALPAERDDREGERDGALEGAVAFGDDGEVEETPAGCRRAGRSWRIGRSGLGRRRGAPLLRRRPERPRGRRAASLEQATRRGGEPGFDEARERVGCRRPRRRPPWRRGERARHGVDALGQRAREDACRLGAGRLVRRKERQKWVIPSAEPAEERSLVEDHDRPGSALGAGVARRRRPLEKSAPRVGGIGRGEDERGLAARPRGAAPRAQALVRPGQARTARRRVPRRSTPGARVPGPRAPSARRRPRRNRRRSPSACAALARHDAVAFEERAWPGPCADRSRRAIVPARRPQRPAPLAPGGTRARRARVAGMRPALRLGGRARAHGCGAARACRS